MIIPIDFVAGSHGHFLEVMLNKFFGIVSDDFMPFNTLGASHNTSLTYQKNRMFIADHWFELYPHEIQKFDKVISIQFDLEDLLLLSSVSLLRAGDANIDNDKLEVDTYKKLNNTYYSDLIDQIHTAYPFLNVDDKHVPRNVLREFFKFGFRNPQFNGYWKKQQQMKYSNLVCVFNFKSFYNYNLLVNNLKEIESFVDLPFNFCCELKDLHSNFLKLNPYYDHKTQCDNIIKLIQSGADTHIPKLTLFQESYINGQLEVIYQKEMPFHDLNYFTSTKDMLNYIETQAPNL